MYETLNTYFSGVLTRKDSKSIPIPPFKDLNKSLAEISYSRKCTGSSDNVETILCTGSSPDEIPNKLQRDFAQQLAKSLKIIFNKSLSSGDVPLDWRSANVLCDTNI